jgi:hypothetical protein
MPPPVTTPARASEPTRSRSRGSVLFLFPVGLIIVLLLGAIAVDLGNVWLQQRRLADAADSAANDAVTFGVDQGALRVGGELELDPARVRSAVDRSVRAHDLPATTGAPAVSIGADADGDPTIEVRLDGDVDLIFGRIVRPGGIAITAVGIAEIVGE